MEHWTVYRWRETKYFDFRCPQARTVSNRMILFDYARHCKRYNVVY